MDQETRQPVPHKGRHHFARCGSYRPVMGNRECELCPDKCPDCGSWYVTPREPSQ